MEFRVKMAKWEVNGETWIWILKEVKVFDRWQEWARISLTDEECNRLGLRVEGLEDEAEKNRHT